MTPEEFITERRKRNHTQSTVAQALGYSVRQVQRWEKGTQEIPQRVAWRLYYDIPSRKRGQTKQEGL